MKMKEICDKVNDKLGFECDLKKSLIYTVLAKISSLLFGLLFMFLRKKAKASGKVCKTRVFTFLMVLFFIGVFSSIAIVPVNNGDDVNECDCDDFEKDFN